MQKKTNTIHRMHWYANRAIQDSGWLGFAAVLLCVCCIVFHQAALLPMQERIHALQSQTANLSKQMTANAHPHNSQQEVLHPAARLAAFYRFFPKQDSLSDSMAKLYDAAIRQNLVLEQGEYTLKRDKESNTEGNMESKLIRYEIVLPVKGGYMQIRQFIAQAKAGMPNLSLDGITFSRPHIQDTTIEAQIRLTLYFEMDKLQLQRPAINDTNAVNPGNAANTANADPFGVKSWHAPPMPLPPLSSAPPDSPIKPVAPSLPFTYVGQMEEGGKHWFILAKGEESYTVKKGDTLDDTYRFDGMENGNLIFQYLPLQIRQILPVLALEGQS